MLAASAQNVHEVFGQPTISNMSTLSHSSLGIISQHDYHDPSSASPGRRDRVRDLLQQRFANPFGTSLHGLRVGVPQVKTWFLVWYTTLTCAEGVLPRRALSGYCAQYTDRPLAHATARRDYRPHIPSEHAVRAQRILRDCQCGGEQQPGALRWRAIRSVLLSQLY